MIGSTLYQAVEKIRQLRSRIVQTLNVPPRVRLGLSLAAALLDGLFEQPAALRDPAGASSSTMSNTCRTVSDLRQLRKEIGDE
jgi:hypothetical protein